MREKKAIEHFKKDLAEYYNVNEKCDTLVEKMLTEGTLNNSSSFNESMDIYPKSAFIYFRKSRFIPVTICASLLLIAASAITSYIITEANDLDYNNFQLAIADSLEYGKQYLSSNYSHYDDTPKYSYYFNEEGVLHFYSIENDTKYVYQIYAFENLHEKMDVEFKYNDYTKKVSLVSGTQNFIELLNSDNFPVFEGEMETSLYINNELLRTVNITL